jgi:hypothetical protein
MYIYIWWNKIWCPAAAGMVGPSFSLAQPDSVSLANRPSCYASSVRAGGPQPSDQVSFLSSFDSCELLNVAATTVDSSTVVQEGNMWVASGHSELTVLFITITA